MLSQNHDISLYEPGTPPTAEALEGPDQHRAFIYGIEICVDRFPGDEDLSVSCFAEVFKTTSGRRASKRTGTAIPADIVESRRRGSAHAHAALRAKRAAQKAEAAV